MVSTSNRKSLVREGEGEDREKEEKGGRGRREGRGRRKRGEEGENMRKNDHSSTSRDDTAS